MTSVIYKYQSREGRRECLGILSLPLSHGWSTELDSFLSLQIIDETNRDILGKCHKTVPALETPVQMHQ